MEESRRNLLLLGGVSAAALVAGTSSGHAQVTSDASTFAPDQVSSLPKEQPEALSNDRETSDFSAAEFRATESDFEFQRPDKNNKWSDLKEAYKDHFTITGDGTLAGELRPNSKRIEDGFAFVPHAADEDFISFHIEPLLDQAADLFDRGVDERRKYDEGVSRYVQLVLELGEYFDLDEIHLEEEQEGFYDHEAVLSHFEHQSEATAQSEQRSLGNFSRRIQEYVYGQDRINRVYAAEQKTAWFNGQIPYLWRGQRFNRYMTPTFDGVTKSISDHSFDAAIVTSDYALDSQKYSWAVQTDNYFSNAAISSARVPGLRTKAEWRNKEAFFNRRRTLVARRYQDLKTRLATDPDGALNYAKYLDASRDRFQQDFRDALARISAVQPMIRDIFGFQENLPTNSLEISYFDDCLLWTRRAIQWLIRFSRRDQNSITPISLKDQMSTSDWSALIAGDTATFSLSASDFREAAVIRLRGIGAVALENNMNTGLWDVSFEAPRNAEVYSTEGVSTSLDQSKIPFVNLARVTQRAAARESDVVGVAALHNVSPIGNWKVKVNGVVPQQNDFSALRDVVVDLHVAYRQSNSGSL